MGFRIGQRTSARRINTIKAVMQGRGRKDREKFDCMDVGIAKGASGGGNLGAISPRRGGDNPGNRSANRFCVTCQKMGERGVNEIMSHTGQGGEESRGTLESLCY